MSAFGLLNSASYNLNYPLVSLKNDIPLPVSISTTAFNEVAIITNATGVSALYQSLPAGNYVAVMTCAISNVTDGTATVVKFAQMQLIDDSTTPILYGSSSSFGKTLDATIANIPNNVLYMNESVYFELTATTNLTVRLGYNLTGGASATRATSFGIAPLTPCSNKVVFYSIV
jgi:hypothetical protein